jgi:glutamyl-tRNA synthetase
MSKQVRVRFAPVQLDLYILAAFVPHSIICQKNNGIFFLRIDTDQNRFVPGAEEYIMEALEWLGCR